MTVRVYRSTDAGAPVLTGQAGSLIGVLDACLVNGFGALASSGWSKDFSGVNLAAYKQPVGTNGMYLRIDDTGTTSARAYGAETMSDVNTGTGLFPTTVQLSAGGYIYKSSTEDATARPWLLVSNGKIFYLFINGASATDWSTATVTTFGDFTSMRSGDAYNTIIQLGTATPGSVTYFHAINPGASALATVANGHWIARSHLQVVSGAVTAGKISDGARSNGSSTIGSGGVAFPSPVDGGLYVAPIYVVEPGAAAVRGVLPGLLNPLHSTKPFAHGDTWIASGDLSGKTLMAVNFNSASSQCLVEISNTW